MMNDSFGGGGFTDQGAGAKSENKAEGTLPVFIKQILMQKDDVVKMFGFEYKMVTTVAVVRNIDHSSTKITYSLQDTTGRINAHLWVEEGDSPSGSAIMLNTYARVIGAVRQQGDVKSIMIYKIQPAKSINEINTHMIEVVNARYQAEEYSKGGMGGVQMHDVNTRASFDTQATQDGPKGKEMVIFKAIQASADTHPDKGVSRQELRAKFPHMAGEIDYMVDKMAAEGNIYSTADSDHFLACF